MHLQAELKNTLQEDAQFMELDVLLPVFKKFLDETINDNLGADIPLKVTLGFCSVGSGTTGEDDANLMDKNWYDHYFPDALQLAHAVNCFIALQQIQ